jgi:hypothetical protein
LVSAPGGEGGPKGCLAVPQREEAREGPEVPLRTQQGGGQVRPITKLAERSKRIDLYLSLPIPFAPELEGDKHRPDPCRLGCVGRLAISSLLMDRAYLGVRLRGVPQHDLDGLIAVSQGVATGRLEFGSLAHKFGQVSGQSPEETSARLAVIVSAYSEQAAKALTAPGILGAEDLPVRISAHRGRHFRLIVDGISA